MRKKKFLKVLSSALVIFLLASLSGCGDSDQKSDSEKPNFSVGLTEEGLLSKIDPTEYVTLAEYKNIEIPQSETAVTDEELNNEINTILESYPDTVQIKDRAVADGDTVNIDYIGRIDGVAFENGSTQGNGTDVTIGQTQYIDDFLDQLVGHMPGETFDVNVTFPDDYGDEAVNGKDAVFETTINYISESKTPALTDEFVTENLSESYGYTSVEDMKSKIKENLSQSKKKQYIWEYMMENSEFEELPSELVDEQLDLQMSVLNAQIKYSGSTMEDYLELYDYEDEDALRESLHEQCEELIKEYIAFQVIYEAEGLDIDEDDLKEFFGSDDLTQYTEYYGAGYMNRLVMDNNVMDYLSENSTVK